MALLTAGGWDPQSKGLKTCYWHARFTLRVPHTLVLHVYPFLKQLEAAGASWRRGDSNLAKRMPEFKQLMHTLEVISVDRRCSLKEVAQQLQAQADSELKGGRAWSGYLTWVEKRFPVHFAAAKQMSASFPAQQALQLIRARTGVQPEMPTPLKTAAAKTRDGSQGGLNETLGVLTCPLVQHMYSIQLAQILCCGCGFVAMHCNDMSTLLCILCSGCPS
jgi:hypothetical protein